MSQSNSFAAWVLVVSVVSGLSAGCGSDDAAPAAPVNAPDAAGGTAGSGGAAGSGGTGGSAGSSGAGATGGADGSGGTSGAGTGGSASSATGGSAGSATGGTGGTGGAANVGRLSGRVVSATTQQPLAGVTVEAGGVSATTAADGTFDLSTVPAGEGVVVHLRRDGFAPGLEVTGIVANDRIEGRYAMLEARAEKKFDAALGGEAVSSDGASAKFEGNSLVRSDGSAVTGEVTLRIAAIDVNDQTELNAFPGEFVGDRSDGTRGLLESVAPMSITVEQGGQQLNVKSGSKALVTFPANESTHSSIELWSLDEQTGRWKEEGVAHLMVDDQGKRVYRAEITHLSWWNCDRVYSGWDPGAPNAQPPPDRACVRGCVKGAPNVITLNYQDKRVPYIAWGRLRGVDYTYGGADLTDGNGCFAIDVKPEGTVEVWADAYFGVSKSRVLKVPASGATARTNPQQCTDVGELVIEPIIVAQCIGLPGSFPAYCGNPAQCVDLLNDVNNCGACGRKCGSEGGGDRQFAAQATPLECVGGECQCVGSLATCGLYQCSDTRRDRNNCGSCDTVCAVGQDCVDGKCQAIQCGPGLTLCGNDCVDLKTSEAHCGDCATACQGGGDESRGGGFTCQNGSCECPTGETKCDRSGFLYCVDTTSTFTDCGACGRSCTVGQECKSGACQAIVCPTGQTLCGSQCVDLQTNINNCGACNRTCVDRNGGDGGGSAPLCTAGSCGCAAGLTDCETSQPTLLDCRDLQSDEQSCGTCGKRCAFDETCNAGSCQRITCGTGLTLCGAECVDLATEEAHCGRCGHACPSSSRGGTGGTAVECLAGSCGCPAATTACFTSAFFDGDAAPLCVTSTSSCNQVPATSCGNLGGEWTLDACGSTLMAAFEQVGCAFTAGYSAYGQFTSASGFSLTLSSGGTCTGTLSGNTLSGGCTIGTSSCSISGTRPACGAGLNLCGTQCVALASDANHCGFCYNYCGTGRVCNAGVCAAAP